VETKEDFRELFSEKVKPLKLYLSELLEYFTTLEATLG
jgi:hypothetical protein